ncbi:hypothetical protein D7Y23_29800 [Corallococcus sp. AB050B]|nr:hypothetical protein D7Y23_29800 [Corallococcus sp. AB050B]
MIQERIRQLPQLIETRAQLKKQSDQLGVFTSRRKQIEELQVRLQRFSAAAALLSREGIGMSSVGTAESIGRLVVEFRTAYAAAPDTALAKSFTQMQEKMIRVLDPLEKAQAEAWTAYATEKLRTLPQELLSILQKIPAFAPTVNEVRSRAAALAQKSRMLPRSAEEFAAFHRAIEDIDAAWRKLGSDNVPPEVVAFLQEAVSQRGAPLELLTDSVRAWLVSYKVNPSFRIRLA